MTETGTATGDPGDFSKNFSNQVAVVRGPAGVLARVACYFKRPSSPGGPMLIETVESSLLRNDPDVQHLEGI